MNYFLNLLAEKQKMITYTKKNGESIAATILQLYPHYFLHLSKINPSNYLKIKLCSKLVFKYKQNITKPMMCYFEKFNLFPMRKIIQGKISHEILNSFIEKGILNKNFNLLRFVYLNKLDFKNIDISSFSKGLGFTGTIKRFNFKQGPKTHGSKSYNRPGSIGAGTTPGRVLKKKRMAGHHGNKKKTLKNVEILEKNNYFLIIKGSIPGPIGSDVHIKVKF